MDSKAWVARAMALALVVPAASACNKQDKTDETIEVKTEAPPPPPAPITIQINPQGGSKIAGELTATHENDKTTLLVNLSGLTEGKDYKAKIRYGDCTIAMQYLTDVDEPGEIDKDKPPATVTPPAGTTATPMTTGKHDLGDVVARIKLDKTGTTATGNDNVDNDKLGPDEPAYVVVTEDPGLGKKEVLVGCADLRGHGDMGGMGAAPAPGAPGAAMPADTGKHY